MLLKFGQGCVEPWVGMFWASGMEHLSNMFGYVLSIWRPRGSDLRNKREWLEKKSDELKLVKSVFYGFVVLCVVLLGQQIGVSGLSTKVFQWIRWYRTKLVSGSNVMCWSRSAYPVQSTSLELKNSQHDIQHIFSKNNYVLGGTLR